MSENIAEVGGEVMSAEEVSDVRLLGWLESSGGLASLREQCSQHTAAGKVRGYRHSSVACIVYHLIRPWCVVCCALAYSLRQCTSSRY